MTHPRFDPRNPFARQAVLAWLLLTLAGPASGQGWPSFRGPNGSGVAHNQSLPQVWDVDSSTHVAWKAAVPGAGISSPVVWGSKVFLTTMDNVEPAEAGHGPAAFQLLAFDTRDGRLRWRRTAVEETLRLGRHPEATHSNATPATDGRHLVAVVGASLLVAYDLEGERLWHRDLGLLDHGMVGSRSIQWGHGSSPVIHRGRVYVQVDRHEESFLAAYEAATGKEVWKAERRELPSWGTPAIHQGPQGFEVITSSPLYARGHDAATGAELWRFTVDHQVTIPTPIVGDDLIYLCGGYPRGQPIHAIRGGARGDVSLDRGESSGRFVAFRTKKGGPYVPTPLVHGNRLYAVNDAGLATTYDAATGKRLDRRRLGAHFTASPVLADGKLFLASEEGEVLVAKAGDQVELLARNDMGEPIKATPAISESTLYVRTTRHLFAIRE